MIFRYVRKNKVLAGYTRRDKELSGSVHSVQPVPNDLPRAGSQCSGPAHEVLILSNFLFPE